MGGAAAQLQAQDAPLAIEDMILPAAPHVGDLHCPHCNAPTFRRSSRLVMPTFREIFYQCRNFACGFTFKASLNVDYGITPSAVPNPAIDLPMRPMDRVPGVTVVETAEPHDPNQFHLFD
jgi:hypothetical protein